MDLKSGGLPWKLPALLILLPLFGQTFQYIIDIIEIYNLAKAWPLLTLPVAAWGLARLDLPYRRLLLLTCLWTLGVAPLVGIWQMGNLIGGAIASTAKVWALTFGFSVPAALVLLRPSPADLRRAVIILGIATFVGLLVIWATAQPADFLKTIDETKIYLRDDVRGDRINVPMFLGLLMIFTLGRSVWARPTWWAPLTIGICLALMVTLFKARLPILGCVTVLALGGLLSNRRWRWWSIGALLAVGALAAPTYLFFHSEDLARELGGSLTYRQAEFGYAVDFLNAEPWRWVIGAGSATRIGDVTLADIVGADYFFLADLGLLGVVFEYGVIGAVLLLSLLIVGLKVAWDRIDPNNPLTGAAFDYILMTLLVSPVTSIVMAPGEALTCVGLAWYLHRERIGRPAFNTRSDLQPDARRSAT